MRSDPAYRNKNIQAQVKAGVDPKIGEWPGDPGYTGSVETRIPKKGTDNGQLKGK